MPDDSALYALGQLLPERKRGEQLLIPHDVLFKRLDFRAVGAFYRLLDVCERIAKKEQKTTAGKHRRDDSVRRRQRSFVREISRVVPYRNAVAVSENRFLDFWRYRVVVT